MFVPEYLQRLIMGLEQTIDNMKYEIPYYKPEDIQLKYAKKFLAASEESLVKAKKELADLRAAGEKEKKSLGP